ncbi:MAG: hypothetical protein KAH77_02970 [Thiomargarita sp.]|nr:hypothetical protein [Thiomargarita sp.]
MTCLLNGQAIASENNLASENSNLFEDSMPERLHAEDTLSFAKILSKPVVSLITKLLQENLHIVNNNDIKYIVMFLEQLDAYYDLFNTYANERVIEHLTDEKYLYDSANKRIIKYLTNHKHLDDINFQTLGFPKPTNTCFFESLYLMNININNQTATYYRTLSLESYFFSFWMRRHNEGNMSLVKEILDSVLPILKKRPLTTQVSQGLLQQQSSQSSQIQQLFESVIQAYKAKDVSLDHLEMQYASEHCLNDTEMQGIYKGYALLTSYYYIAGLKYFKESYSHFRYPTKWQLNKKVSSIIDNKTLQLFVKVIQAYKAKDVNLDHLKISYASKHCLNDKKILGISKGYALLTSYYYIAGLKYLKESYSDFRYPINWKTQTGKSLSFAKILSKPVVSFIITAFQNNFKIINNKEIQYIAMFLEQLDVYYDVFYSYANERIIKHLNNNTYLSDNDFYVLGLPKHKNRCFLEYHHLENIHIKNYGKTYYNLFSIEGYFYSFWLRRHNEGNTALVKEILDVILLLLKSR